MVASLSAHNYVNHSIDNCTVLLLFNTLALVHQSDPVASGSVHVL